MPIVQLGFFLFGLAFGSFANVCIFRWPREESVANGRSHCPHCKSLIAWYDNIPLLSYFILSGRCRRCMGSISWRYPFVELTSGLGFLASSYFFIGTEKFAVAMLFWALLVSFWIDYDFRILPDEINLPFIPIGIIVTLLSPLYDFSFLMQLLPFQLFRPELIYLNRLIFAISGTALGAGIIWLIRVIGQKIYGQEAMGLGDLKFMSMIGAWLGPVGCVRTLFIGAILGGIVSVVLLILRKVERKSYIPFGPFLALGACWVLFE